jgi:hypothetical protein
MLQIYKRHMVGGEKHEHIAKVLWRNTDSGKDGESTRADMVEWLDKTKDNQAYVSDVYGNLAFVGTIHPENSPAYIRTYADKKWTDNLLALDTY